MAGEPDIDTFTTDPDWDEITIAQAVLTDIDRPGYAVTNDQLGIGPLGLYSLGGAY